MKKCSRCKKELLSEMFHKDKNSVDGLFSWCKKCKSEYYTTGKWREYGRNLARTVNRKEYSKKYYREHPEKYNNTKYINNNEYHRNYRKTEKWRIYALNYERFNLKNNIQAKLAKTLRTRLYGAFKKNQKRGSAVRDLGCTIIELKQHLESQFKEGMNWENHGMWHIDHIIPLSSFDLYNRNELLKAVHYTNLQPLWAKDNLMKSSKLIDI